MYVEVSIPISLFRTFTYSVPKKYIKSIFIGQSITVPFNKKQIAGFITEINLKSNFKGKILPLSNINNNSFKLSNDLLKTINWISKYYISPIGSVFHNTINYQHRKKFSFPQSIYFNITDIGIEEYKNIKFKSQNAILSYIINQGRKVNLDELKYYAKSYIQVCKRLVEKGFLEISKKDNLTGVLKQKNIITESSIKLTSGQNTIYNSILKEIKNNNHKTIFLGGVPASGKTIVYSKILDYYLRKNKNIIILVPEIALVQQLYEKLRMQYKKNVGIRCCSR